MNKFSFSSGESLIQTATIDRCTHVAMGRNELYCIWSVATLSEPLDDGNMLVALERLLRAVPVLSSRIVPRFFRGHWEYVEPSPEDLKGCILREQAFTEEELQNRLQKIIKISINSSKPPLIRFTSIDAPEKHLLVIQIHHVALDGDGTKRVLERFAAYYRECSETGKAEISKVDSGNHNDESGEVEKIPLCPDRSIRQMAKFLPWWFFVVAPFVAVWSALKSMWCDLRCKKNSLVIGDRPGVSANDLPEDPCFASIIIEKSLLNGLKDKSVVPPTTVNDALMAALMRTVYVWNADRGRILKRLKTGYTGNIRRWWGEPEGTFANMSMINTLTVPGAELSDPDRASKAVKGELNFAKRTMGMKDLCALGSMFVLPEWGAMKIASFLYGPLINLIKKVHAITNIGIIPDSVGDFGHSKAQSFSLLAPIHPGPSVLLTASTFKGEMTVYIGFDRIHLDFSSARAFLELLKVHLKEQVTSS